MSITCSECGEVVPTIDWAVHRQKHNRVPVQSSMPFKPTKRLMKAASNLLDTIAEAGGGSIGVSYAGGRKEEIVSIPPKSNG